MTYAILSALLVSFIIGFALVLVDNYGLKDQLKVYQEAERRFKTSMDDPITRRIMCVRGKKGT